MIAYLYKLVVAGDLALRFFWKKLIILFIILEIRETLSSFNQACFRNPTKDLKTQLNTVFESNRDSKKALGILLSVWYNTLSYPSLLCGDEYK